MTTLFRCLPGLCLAAVLLLSQEMLASTGAPSTRSDSSFSCCQSRQKVSETLDYSKETLWAALPQTQNASHEVPTNTSWQDGQADATVDLFYVYPTIYTGDSHNAPLNDARLSKKVQQDCLRPQASVFNNSARIYAPYYRQASMNDYTEDNLQIAYADIRAAFSHYLAAYNSNRPIALVGHSQGANMVVRLLQEFFDGQELQKRLVVAYVIGENVGEGNFNSLQGCDSADQTGCVVSFSTMLEGAGQSSLSTGEPKGTLITVNPLTWKRDTTPADASLHLGGVPSSFDRIDIGLTGARIDDGAVRIPADSSLQEKGYSLVEDYPGDLHMAEFEIWAANLRENFANRIKQLE